MTLLDLEVEARATRGCYDWLTLSDKDSAATQIDYCGTMKTISEPTVNIYEKLLVKFQPDPMNNFRGFLIKFEGMSYMDVTKNEETFRLHLEYSYSHLHVNSIIYVILQTVSL